MTNLKEIVTFSIVCTAFILSAVILGGCTIEVTHEWDGSDIPIIVDYPDYIIVSGNFNVPSYNLEVGSDG